MELKEKIRDLNDLVENRQRLLGVVEVPRPPAQQNEDVLPPLPLPCAAWMACGVPVLGALKSS